MNKKVFIITGASGMDTKELTHQIISNGHLVILTYRQNSQQDLSYIKSIFTNDLEKKTNSQLFFEYCEISDQFSVHSCIKKILEKFGKIDNILLSAGMSHVGQSMDQRELTIKTNGQSYYYFLESIKNLTPNTRIIGFLTSELFSKLDKKKQINEQSQWNPTSSPYAIGKALGGHWINYYRENEGIFCCNVVLFSHSSIYRGKNFFIRKLINSFARICLGKQDFVEFGSLDFWRDEGNASIYMEAVIKMVENHIPEDFILATGEAHHAEEFLDIVGEYFNINWKNKVKFNESYKRNNETYKLIGDSGKARKKLGFRPNRLSFKDHIKLMCQYDYELEKNGFAIRPDVLSMFP